MPDIFDEFIDKIEQRTEGQAVVKIKEDLIAWRDEQENSMLHLAAWNGELKLARAVFDSIKGRKLTTTQNKLGATPLALAIIAGQVI